MIAVAVLAALTAPGAASAQVPGREPRSRSPGSAVANVPTFIGSAATPDPTRGQDVPRHPFMAPNGLSNIHDDAYQTDTYRWAGPLGDRPRRRRRLCSCASAPRSPSTAAAAW